MSTDGAERNVAKESGRRSFLEFVSIAELQSLAGRYEAHFAKVTKADGGATDELAACVRAGYERIKGALAAERETLATCQKRLDAATKELHATKSDGARP